MTDSGRVCVMLFKTLRDRILSPIPGRSLYSFHIKFKKVCTNMEQDVKILIWAEPQSIARAANVPVKSWYHQNEWQNASGHRKDTVAHTGIIHM